MSYKISFIFMLMLAFFACKDSVDNQSATDLKALEKAVNKQPNGENISKLLDAYNTIIQDKETDRKQLKNTLDKAYKVAAEQDWSKELIGITTNYLRDFPGDKGNEEKAVKLIYLMKQRNQSKTVEALQYAFVEAYPESEYVDSFKVNLAPDIQDMDGYLKIMAEKIFENPDETGINVVNAREYVNACEAMSLILPAKSNTPRYLFNAAEMSRTMRTFDKTLYLYDWIIDKYPQYEKTPMTLFMKGFILENEMNNIEMAKEIYKEFLQKYPSHDLADDVQFLYDNIGKSNEEILKMIEANKAAK